MINLVYAKLVNFAAILLGTGRDTFEFDRSDSPNNIIIIKGPNGSSKSSILQELTPFTIENTISRNTRRIIPGKDGSKELHYLVNNRYLYKCKIYYTDKKTSAYISKTDTLQDNPEEIELNPNGNISTYEEILDIELGVNKSYQRVGYLSPDLVNFINLKASERSNYISSIMPDISSYVKGYEIVSKKSNEKKREIDNINKELGRLSSINYEVHLNSLKTSIQSLNQSLDKIKENNTKCEVFINDLEKYRTEFEKLDKYKTEFATMVNELNIFYNKIKMNQETFDKYGSDKTKLNNVIQELEKEILLLQEREFQTRNQIQNLELSTLQKTKIMDNQTLTENISLDNILKEIETLESENNNFIKLLNDLKESNQEIILFFDLMNTTSIYEFSRIMDFILDTASKIEDNFYNLNILNEKVLSLEKESVLVNTQEEENNNNIKQTEEKIKNYNISDDMINLYNLRDSNCNTKCAIIKELEKYISLKDEKDLLNKHLELLLNQKDSINKSKELLSEKIYNINQNIKILVNINDYINTNKHLFDNFNDNIRELFKKDLNIIIDTLKSIKIKFNDFREYIHLKDKSDSIINTLNQLKVKKTNIITKYDLEKEIETLEYSKNLLNEIRANIQIKTDELNNLNQISELKTKIEKDTEEYNKNYAKVNDFKNKLLKLNEAKYYYKHLKKNYIDIQCERTIQEKEKSEKEKELELLKSEYINKQQLEKLRNDYLEIKKKYDILASIWNVKTGYPSLIIQNYLNKLKEITNADLEHSWGDDLYIEDFVISSTEFSISMNRSGSIIPDCSMLSQGEKSLLTLSLSLALIKMQLAERPYRILKIDELDGMLDDKRAKSYLRILQEKIDEMQVQSCFVVSHRENYEAINADVIILAKNENLNQDFYKNKNIIFKL